MPRSPFILGLVLLALPPVSRAQSAEGLDDQLQQITEDLSGESDLSKWAQPSMPYRRAVVLALKPGSVERAALARIVDFSPQRLATEGKWGSGAIAHLGSGKKLDTRYEAAKDSLLVCMPKDAESRQDF